MLNHNAISRKSSPCLQTDNRRTTRSSDIQSTVVQMLVSDSSRSVHIDVRPHLHRFICAQVSHVSVVTRDDLFVRRLWVIFNEVFSYLNCTFSLRPNGNQCSIKYCWKRLISPLIIMESKTHAYESLSYSVESFSSTFFRC